MHFPTYKTLSTAVLVSGTIAAIPTVHGAPARFSVQPRLPQDDSNIGPGHFTTPPLPQFNWRTEGPGTIKVQRGHQNPLRFSQEPTTLPDVYKTPRAMGHLNRARMEANTADEAPTPDTWVEGLIDMVGLETAEIELLEHAINKRGEIIALIVDETELVVPYNSQSLSVLLPNSLQGGLDMHDQQARRMREAAKTLKKAALMYLEFSEALQHNGLPIELETSEKTSQDFTILSNMAKDDNFVEIVGLGMVKLAEQEKKASVEDSKVFSEAPTEEL
ncbi:hypothetical protein L211DRAFT_848795 [Terfezia boudieri ATCC MYA-4762]|uniref:Uncharacterized protein n=1 Tax=Terfezia boudieri ATCC MYA-4762 TaxID=1051890 RepID=A0A3N4LNR0_9PEZI|nr:hypothetical protein L211DRAFT_848795 [Terfezia boudieri ATCC MYA-4762]